MYEHHKEPVLPRQQFLRRAARHGGVSAPVILLSLGIGTFGYREFGGLPWIGSILNDCVILTGMGPVSTLTSDAAKLFTSRDALYSGIVFVAATGVLLAPFLHRVVRRMHATDQEEA